MKKFEEIIDEHFLVVVAVAVVAFILAGVWYGILHPPREEFLTQCTAAFADAEKCAALWRDGSWHR